MGVPGGFGGFRGGYRGGSWGGSRWIRGFTDTLLFVVIKDTYGLGGDKTSFANLFKHCVFILYVCLLINLNKNNDSLNNRH